MTNGIIKKEFDKFIKHYEGHTINESRLRMLEDRIIEKIRKAYLNHAIELHQDDYEYLTGDNEE